VTIEEALLRMNVAQFAKDEREAYLVEHPEKRTIYDGLSADERAARSRLGAWLAAEPGRTWDDWSRFSTVEKVVVLMPYAGDFPNCANQVQGSGPTLAAAICDALGNAEPTK
jgi:hypothetical protein